MFSLSVMCISIDVLYGSIFTAFLLFQIFKPKRALNHHYSLKTEFDLFHDQKNQQLLCISIIIAV